jgi:type I restriction enzyme, S subunit
MAGEWVTMRLGEFVHLQRGHDLPDERRRPGDVPVLGSFGVTGWHDQARAAGPGVTIGRSGASFGVVSYSAVDYWPLNTALYVVDFHGNLPRFAYYFLKTLDFARFNSGSAQPSLNRNFIHPLEVQIPPAPEQAAIAELLGALDDKIEQNRRVSKTLAAMAQAIFQSWFIDFDPAQAEAGKRSSRYNRAIEAIPSTCLTESPAGEIPEEWSPGSLGNIVSRRAERAGSRDVVILSAVSTGKLIRSDEQFARRVYSEETNNYLAVHQWDLAYNPSRINIGSIGMLEEDIVGAVSPVYVVVQPHPKYRWFLDFFLRRQSTRERINTLASGSVRQSLSFQDFASIPCVVPPILALEEFDRLWLPLRDRIQACETECSTLAHLRDSLLPKLISGEMRIAHAERKISAAS